jgi:mycofactocin precursor
MAPSDDVETDSHADSSTDAVSEEGSDALVADEVLVEEISIDGMCGVY